MSASVNLDLFGETSPRALRPFFSYFGGKWRLAPSYPRPQFSTIVEPFAGSAGYATRYPDRKVILCDKNPVIAAIWRYLLRVSAAELVALPDVPTGTTVNDLAIPQEARWLIGFWLGPGEAHARLRGSTWMRDYAPERMPGKFWGPLLRRRLASQLDAIRHWTIHEGDYREVPVTGSATWFIDPPYQHAGVNYRRHGSQHLDFDALGAWCRSRPGQVIVCEGAGADWLPFRDHREQITTRPGRFSREVVFYRGAA